MWRDRETESTDLVKEKDGGREQEKRDRINREKIIGKDAETRASKEKEKIINWQNKYKEKWDFLEKM